MITEEQLILMTAGIDGELTREEAKRLRSLLSSSVAARVVYARLKSDRDRLGKLPRVAAPATLPKRVMSRVAAITPPPILRPTPKSKQPPTSVVPPARNRRWLPLAIAASLLVGITASSFWLFTRDRQQPTHSHGPGGADWARWLPSEDGHAPSTPAPDKTGSSDDPVVLQPGPEAPLPRLVQPTELAHAPEPRLVRPDLHAFPAGAEIPPFDFVEVRVPILKALAEFSREDIRQELAQELGRDPAYRIDLFARDPARGIDLFQAAARTSGVTVFTDATTPEKLRKRQANAVVIYSESLTPTELAELMGKLCAEDAKVSPRVFDVLHATPASPIDQKALIEILGTDPGIFKRPAATDKGLDISKPISAGTADHVVKSVTGTSTGKPTDKTAVIMTASPLAARTPLASSAELKQFLAKRGQRKAGAVPILIVIRPGNG